MLACWARLLRAKQYADAEPLLLEAYQGTAARNNAVEMIQRSWPDRAREWIAALYRNWGKPEKASEWTRDYSSSGNQS